MSLDLRKKSRTITHKRHVSHAHFDMLYAEARDPVLWFVEWLLKLLVLVFVQFYVWITKWFFNIDTESI